MNYNTIYEQYDNVWGTEPDDWLKDLPAALDKKEQILELGVGDGRNVLWLASHGYKVTGIDSSRSGIESAKTKAHKYRIPICLLCKDINEFEYEANAFQLIYSFWTLNFISNVENKTVIQKIKKSIKKGGYFLAGVFTVPWHTQLSEKDQVNGITNSKGIFLYGFNQLLHMFHDFRVLKYEESIIEDSGHAPDFKPHQHYIAMILAQNISNKDEF